MKSHLNLPGSYQLWKINLVQRSAVNHFCLPAAGQECVEKVMSPALILGKVKAHLFRGET